MLAVTKLQEGGGGQHADQHGCQQPSCLDRSAGEGGLLLSMVSVKLWEGDFALPSRPKFAAQVLAACLFRLLCRLSYPSGQGVYGG